VVQAPTITAVTPSVTTVAANTAFSILAFVDTQSASSLSSGGSSGAAPTGTITFFAGTTNLGSIPATIPVPPLDSLGYVAAQATLTGVKLTATAIITAVYNGDGNYTASPASAGVTVTVSGAPTFTVTPANNGVLTATAPGQSGSDTIAVASTTGYSGTVTLAVASISPNNLTDPPSCSFGTTGTITLSCTAESGMGTLTCTTTAAASSLLSPFARPHPQGPSRQFANAVNSLNLIDGTAIAIACLFVLSLAGRKRQGTILLAIALAAVVLVGVSCGGGSSSGSGGGTNTGTTVTQYTIIVNATPSTGSVQQATLTLNVN
jgi:hypothetical protein